MAHHSNPSKAKAALSSPEQVLEALTGLLCFRSNAQSPSSNCQWSDIPWESSDDTEEEEGEACDFSSFPSLSLQKKTEDGVAAQDITGDDQPLFHDKEGVEAHVASLLARPVLVSHGPGEMRLATDDESEDDESFEFMEANITKIPSLLQQNLILSFSTLMQSRLRAYGTFLARHGLSLAKSKSMRELEEGVAGVTQKLETMLEIGNLVSLGDVVTSFVAHSEKVCTSLEGDDDLKVSLPLCMRTSIRVFLPKGEQEVESLSLDIEASGTITGK